MGAKHAEREFSVADEAVDTYPVKQLTGAVVLFAALVNLATDLWVLALMSILVL